MVYCSIHFFLFCSWNVSREKLQWLPFCSAWIYLDLHRSFFLILFLMCRNTRSEKDTNQDTRSLWTCRPRLSFQISWFQTKWAQTIFFSFTFVEYEEGWLSSDWSFQIIFVCLQLNVFAPSSLIPLLPPFPLVLIFSCSLPANLQSCSPDLQQQRLRWCGSCSPSFLTEATRWRCCPFYQRQLPRSVVHPFRW